MLVFRPFPQTFMHPFVHLVSQSFSEAVIHSVILSVNQPVIQSVRLASSQQPVRQAASHSPFSATFFVFPAQLVAAARSGGRTPRRFRTASFTVA